MRLFFIALFLFALCGCRGGDTDKKYYLESIFKSYIGINTPEIEQLLFFNRESVFTDFHVEAIWVLKDEGHKRFLKLCKYQGRHTALEESLFYSYLIRLPPKLKPNVGCQLTIFPDGMDRIDLYIDSSFPLLFINDKSY